MSNSNFKEKPFDFIVTNPPFGIQSIPNADMKFLESAYKLGEEGIFSMHKACTSEYIKKFYSEKDNGLYKYSGRNFLFDIPKTYSFHKDKIRNIEVVFADGINTEYY